MQAMGGMIPQTWWQWTIGGALTVAAVIEECYLKPRAERKDAEAKAARARLLAGVRLSARER